MRKHSLPLERELPPDSWLKGQNQRNKIHSSISQVQVFIKPHNEGDDHEFTDPFLL